MSKLDDILFKIAIINNKMRYFADSDFKESDHPREENGQFGLGGSVNPRWTDYNNLHNEGGEGYNPHEKYHDGRTESEKTRSQIEELQRKIRNAEAYGDPNFLEKIVAGHQAKIDDLTASLPADQTPAAIAAKKSSDFSKTWTKEVTAERRAAWNNVAKNGGQLMAIEKKLGFTKADLKKAVALYE